MATLLLFHHALGLTPGCRAFADEIRAAGHDVRTPDLYEGKTFSKITEGVAHANDVGFDTIIERGLETVGDLRPEIVYAGFSLGVMPAQKLAQTRPGAKGALLFHAAVPLEYFGPWPSGVPLQMHTMEGDEMGDVDIARELAKAVPGAELFLYPGKAHLFADNSLPDYDESAASLLKQRTLEFLAKF